jgi:hypothetical protein
MSKIISFTDNVSLIYKEAASKILRHTPQLFIPTKDSRKPFEAFGSGVLYRYGNKHFLITAAHCIKQRDELIKIGILDKGNLHLLKGTVIIHRGNKDEIDIAIVCLAEESIAACNRKFEFLTHHNILQNRNMNVPTEYCVVGHPISKTYIDVKRKMVTHEPLLFIGKSKDQHFYDKIGLDIRVNTLIGFNKRRSSFLGENEMNISPEPKGISGCGLWYIPSYFVEDIKNVNYMLSGIMIEHHINKNVMVSTKIEAAMTLIALHANNYFH